METKHFYTIDGAYCKDENVKKDIDDISEAIAEFFIPIYNKYKAMGYPAIEVSQVIADQMQFGLIHYRLKSTAEHAKEKADQEKQN